MALTAVVERSGEKPLWIWEMRRKSYPPQEALRNPEGFFPRPRRDKTPRTARDVALDQKDPARGAGRRACNCRAFGKRNVRNGRSGSPRFCRSSRLPDTRGI